ncbi:CoA-transferase subunit beta [Salinisphaera hydrothermalis]|uniref:CoA-transferase subunit beta n=1 Tax=Salinisphaera hydrothermalis TaxID=563188 RepID=UPI003340E7D8
MSERYSASEMMTVTASRALTNGQSCFVGIGLPSEAANLARLTHAPDVVLIYESGTLETKPDVLPLSIGDGELCETALTTVSVPEMFRYWVQGGKIDVGFLGAAQIDKYANLNTTLIGDYTDPKVRLPGGGGAPEMATATGEIFITLKQSKRTFVEAVDFVTTVGFGRDGTARDGIPNIGKGPTRVITDLCVMQPNPTTKELTVTSLHPDVSREDVIEATGWDIVFADNLTTTAEPDNEELDVLRQLKERTEKHHSEA